MQRKNFYLSDNEIELLIAEAARLDLAASDVLRRIIDAHFENCSMISGTYIHNFSGMNFQQ